MFSTSRPAVPDRIAHSIGVIGGGQLARMMQPAAIGLGIRLRLLAEEPDSSAAQVIADPQVGDFTDPVTVGRFARSVDAITFDHEHVPTRILHQLVDAGHGVYPGPDSLVYAQDKVLMRQRLGSLDAPMPAWQVCDSAAELAGFGDRQGWPVIAKTSRGGYDGRGVFVIEGPDQAGLPFDGKPAISAGEPVRILAEEFVDFTRELSVLAVRGRDGAAVVYPVSETLQRDGICLQTITPAPGLDAGQAAALQDLAVRLASELGVVGVLAVELMQRRDGTVVVNELAMRPHNTGHWSIDGALTSQFENHLRAVAGLPLGSTAPRQRWTVMRNLLGGRTSDLLTASRAALADPQLKVHLYGKRVHPGRKVGHLSLAGDDLSDLVERTAAAAVALEGAQP